MHKKKSYMNKFNLLSEDFFKTLKKYLIKYPTLKRNKKVRNKIKDLNAEVMELEKIFKSIDPEHKSIKLSKYKLTDFI